jgi:acetyl esterase/lipase
MVTLAALGATACTFPGPSRIRSEAVTERYDLVFARRGDVVLRLDLYTPAGVGPSPVIVLLHPGGWTMGSKALMAGTARDFARAGFAAVVPNYRLAPAHRFPAQLEDVRDAVRWAREHAEALDLDPDRVGAFGYSAGAQLAALLGTDPGPGARVQAVAVGGTPADLAALQPSRETRALLGHDAQANRFAEASPISHVSRDDPPFFLFHGRFDRRVGVAQARRLRDALQRLGVPTGYREGWLGHFGTFLLQREWARSAIPFFDRWLRDPASLADTRSRSRAG